MHEFDADAIRREFDFDFFLNSSRGFDWLNETRLTGVLFDGDRKIIRKISSVCVFRCMPEPVATINPPNFATALAELRVVFLEQILAADKPKPDDARPDIGGDDEFHFAVRNPATILPATVRDFFNRHSRFHRRNASCRPPSTLMIWPVVLLRRFVSSRKIASAWSAGVMGCLVKVRSA